MGSIRRVDRPKPWLARYRAPDGRQHAKTFRRKIDAEKWLITEEAAALRGEWVDPPAGAVTLREWAESWLVGRAQLKPKSRALIESVLRGRILPAFGDVQLKRITVPAVRHWVESMVAEGHPARARQARQILGQMLGQAVADGVLPSNPVQKVKAPTVRPRRQLFLTAFQLGRLADESGRYAPLVWLLGWSGLRWGEAVALRVGRVDMKRRRIRVEEAAIEVGGRLSFGAPKTHETRTVIVPRFVITRLEPLLTGRQPDELVFTAPKGGPLRLSNFTRRVWKPAVDAAELPSDLLIHDLRDTAASLAISTGASIKAVQRMLGHASAAMTLDTYGSLFEEDLEDLADRLEERYG